MNLQWQNLLHWTTHMELFQNLHHIWTARTSTAVIVSFDWVGVLRKIFVRRPKQPGEWRKENIDVPVSSGVPFETFKLQKKEGDGLGWTLPVTPMFVLSFRHFLCWMNILWWLIVKSAQRLPLEAAIEDSRSAWRLVWSKAWGNCHGKSDFVDLSFFYVERLRLRGELILAHNIYHRSITISSVYSGG